MRVLYTQDADITFRPSLQFTVVMSFCLSQLSAVTCGFMLKLYGGLEDAGFLQQLHSVGILAEFESLLSTNGDEEGILEDMEVGVADLSDVAFTITKAKTEEDLLPMLTGTWCDTHFCFYSLFHLSSGTLLRFCLTAGECQ
uniref:type II inositol 3,4-bisphosphate 4-phosphatase-like n=1 Tax=Monopterus albus TaxID=43700 RepID=UPI0009B3CA30